MPANGDEQMLNALLWIWTLKNVKTTTATTKLKYFNKNNNKTNDNDLLK